MKCKWDKNRKKAKTSEKNVWSWHWQTLNSSRSWRPSRAKCICFCSIESKRAFRASRSTCDFLTSRPVGGLQSYPENIQVDPIALCSACRDSDSGGNGRFCACAMKRKPRRRSSKLLVHSKSKVERRAEKHETHTLTCPQAWLVKAISKHAPTVRDTENRISCEGSATKSRAAGKGKTGRRRIFRWHVASVLSWVERLMKLDEALPTTCRTRNTWCWLQIDISALTADCSRIRRSRW